MIARSDYAANAGDQRDPLIDGTVVGNWVNGSGPFSYTQADTGQFEWFPFPYNRTDYTRPDGVYGPTGVIYRRSETRISALTNKGTSNTYLIGEQFLPPNKYFPGGGNLSDGGDDLPMYGGYDNDGCRVTYFLPVQDGLRPPAVGFFRFGSAHPSGFNMLMCDGSVSQLSYAIDPKVFRTRGNRFGDSAFPARP
jgi:prepilin-type processing-associated H-X9-DG protein